MQNNRKRLQKIFTTSLQYNQNLFLYSNVCKTIEHESSKDNCELKSNFIIWSTILEQNDL